MNRHFSKDGSQMATRHMKNYSRSVIIREMEVKANMRYHFKPCWMAKKKIMTNVEDAEKIE